MKLPLLLSLLLLLRIAVEAKVPFLRLAITAVAAATMSHSLFPPQAGPTALVEAYGADMGMVYIFGIIVFIPAVICAGIILPRFMKNLDRPVPTLMKQSKQFTEEEMPRFATSILVPLSPAIIITCGTILKLFVEEGSIFFNIINFIQQC